MWLGVLALVLAVAALAMACVLWFREKKHHQQDNCCCQKTKRCLCTLTTRVADLEANSNSLIGSFDFIGGITGTNSATALSIVDGVGPPNNVVASPFDGTVTALSFIVSEIPTAGSITAVVTINGVASTLSATIDSTATSTAVTAAGSVAFVAGDLVGISFTSTDVDFADQPVTLTAQAFVNYAI